MSRIRENIFLTVTILLCILLFGVKLTGSVWHVVFGVMLVIVSVSHICMRFVKMKYQKKKVRMVDEVLIGALAVMFVTGMLMNPLEGMLAVKILHKLSSVVFFLGMAGHVVQHKAIRNEKQSQIAAETEKKERSRKGGIYVS